LPAASSQVVAGRCEDTRTRYGIEDLESLRYHLWANPITTDHGQIEGPGSARLNIPTLDVPVLNIVAGVDTRVGHRRIVAVADLLQPFDLRPGRGSVTASSTGADAYARHPDRKRQM
jgi:hypothetical protein